MTEGVSTRVALVETCGQCAFCDRVAGLTYSCGHPDGMHKGNIDTGTNRVDPYNPPPEACPLPKLVEFQKR